MNSDNNTYYTPSIEEFYQGFEYEHLWGNKWKKSIYGENEEETHNFDRDGEWYHPSLFCKQFKDEELRKLNYRVRHLCHEDIVRCGWGIGSGSLDYNLLHFQLDIDLEDRNKITLTDQYNNSTLFLGTIRNRSELLRIMKMVGIERKPELLLPVGVSQVDVNSKWECCKCGWIGAHKESADKTPIEGNMWLLVCPKCGNKDEFYKQ